MPEVPHNPLPPPNTTADAFAQVYQELRALAGLYLRRVRNAATLQPTALVHEAYVRLAGLPGARFRSKEEFLGLAASVMRRVLVDHARRRNAAKRGGGQRRLTIDSGCEDQRVGPGPIDLLVLDEALTRLHAMHARQARLVELRLFAGLTVDAAASMLGISPSTAFKDWEIARAWLLRELRADEP